MVGSNPTLPTMKNNQDIELDRIRQILHLSQEYDLQVEVVWSAMKYLSENHQDGIVAALNYGLKEWIK